MENTTQQKKTNWLMIILLVILVPILLLGYKFFSKKLDANDNQSSKTTHNSANTNNGNGAAINQNTDFLSGVWYRNDPNLNVKYIFSAPENVNGTLQGQLDIVMDDKSDGKVNYEVLENGKLRISDPKGTFNSWEMEYVYNQNGNTLEIISSGNSATFTRNSVYVAKVNTSNSTTAQNSVSGNMTAQQNQNTNTSNLPPVGFDSKPANFKGNWVYVGRKANDASLTIEDLEQHGTEVSGLIHCDQWENNNQTSEVNNWSFNGDIKGNQVYFTIYNGNGKKSSTGTLTKNGNTATFSLSKSSPFFPMTAKLNLQ